MKLLANPNYEMALMQLNPGLPPSKSVPKITEWAKAALQEKGSQKRKEIDGKITKDANPKEIVTKRTQAVPTPGNGKKDPVEHKEGLTIAVQAALSSGPVLATTWIVVVTEVFNYSELDMEIKVIGEACAKIAEDKLSEIKHCDDECYLIWF